MQDFKTDILTAVLFLERRFSLLVNKKKSIKNKNNSYMQHT